MMTKQTRHGSRPDVLKEFDRRLREQRARLTVDVRSDLEESEQSYSELVGEVRDSGDESNAALQADSEHAELFRHANALGKIDAAQAVERAGVAYRAVGVHLDWAHPSHTVYASGATLLTI